MPTHSRSSAEALATEVGFERLGERLGGDEEDAVNAALNAGAVFPGGGDALATSCILRFHIRHSAVS